MAKVLVPLAQGCEELEAVTVINILRRAKIDVVTAGLDGNPVEASRGVMLLPDTTLDDVIATDFDLVALPGGAKGAENLAKDKRVAMVLKKAAEGGKLVAAICAAPKVLAQAGLLTGKKATAYPGVLDPAVFPDIEIVNDAVVRDGNIVTSRGPGTAMDFALSLVEALTNAATRQSVEEALVR